MALKINTTKIKTKHLYKDELVDSDGKKYPISLSLKQLREATKVTEQQGPVLGNAYLEECLDLPFEIDFETLDTIVSNAIKQFHGKTPR